MNCGHNGFTVCCGEVFNGDGLEDGFGLLFGDSGEDLWAGGKFGGLF